MEKNSDKKDNLHTLYPYSVPEGYFDSLKANILHRIEEEGDDAIQIEEAPRTWYQKMAPYLYLAAVMVGFVLLMRLIPTKESPVNTLDNATSEVYDEFLLEETAEDYWGVVFVNEMPDDESTLLGSNFWPILEYQPTYLFSIYE